jgi:heme o synthase
MKSIARRLSLAQRMAPWLELAKPGITRLVVSTTAFGALVAPGHLAPLTWLVLLLGTALVVGGANALNQVAEIESDALMERTRNRPLPTGRLEPAAAARAAFAAAGVGTALLLTVQPLSALLALAALISYVWIYTPLKRVTPHALYVGAVPGALPPLIGYAAASGGHLDAPAWALFVLLSVWQVPHFLAIAVFRRDEYARAGMPVFGVDSSPRAVRWLMLFWSLALFAVSLVPVSLGQGGKLYLSVALAFGAAFVVGTAFGLRRDAGPEWARSLFLASMPYLVLLFAGLAL